MSNDWLGEVQKRVQKDARYRYWKRSADKYGEYLRVELTQQQYEYLEELLLANQMMSICEKDHAYEIGVIHGRNMK